MLAKALSATLSALLLVGCGHNTVPSPLPADHPANPAAAEAPIPPLSKTLDVRLAAAENRDASEEMPAMQHDHGARRHDDDSAEAGDGDMTATQPKAAQALYVCPMHKKVVSDKPGKCPICKMKLKLKARPFVRPAQQNDPGDKVGGPDGHAAPQEGHQHGGQE